MKHWKACALALCFVLLTGAVATSRPSQIWLRRNLTGYVEVKLSQWFEWGPITPQMFGALGNDSADDYAAIALAVTAGSTGGGRIYFPKGTYRFSSPIIIDANQVELEGDGASQTILKYTGGAAAAAIRVGNATPLTTQRQGIRIAGMTIRGNASTTDVLLIQGVFRSHFSRLSLMDATQSGLHTLWCVVCTFEAVHVSGLDWQGNFLVQPATGMLFDDIDVSHKTTASTVIDPVVEGVSGSGILLSGASNMVFTGGTSEWNNRGIDLPFGTDGTQNVFIGIDLEQNTTEDIRVATADNHFLGILSAGLTHLAAGAQGCVFSGGFYKNLTIDANAFANSFDITHNNGTIIDNGLDTKVFRLMNSGTVKLEGIPWSLRDTVPATAYTNIGTPDKQDTLTGNYSIVGTTQTQLSNTVYAATVWRVLFIGSWANNIEGGALVQPAPFIEVTSAAPTFAIGTPVVTVSLDGSGHLQMTSGNAAHRVGFSGRIFMLPNLLGAAGTTSMFLKGIVAATGIDQIALANLTIGGTTASGVILGRSGWAVSSAGAWSTTRSALTYGTTVALNAANGNEFIVTPTDGVAFTVSNPTNPTTGQRITFRVKNTFGVLGAITMGTAYKFVGAATFPVVANGTSQAIDFQYDGANWIQASPVTGAVPN